MKKTLKKVLGYLTNTLIFLSLIVNLFLVYNITKLTISFKGNITNQTDFITLVNKLAEKINDLTLIMNVSSIYRILSIILLIVLSMYIVITGLEDENNIYKLNLVSSFLTATFTAYLMYLSKNLYYAIFQIVNEKYKEGIPQAIYLLGRVQELLYSFKVIIILIIVIITFSILALISFLKKEENINRSKSIKILAIFEVLLISLIGLNNYTIYTNKFFKPFSYMVINYTHKENDVYITGSVNMRKVNENNLDPAIRNFYLTGVNYEFSNSDQALKSGEKKHIKVSYDLDTKELLGFKTGNLEKDITIYKIPQIVKDKKDFNEKTLFNFLGKYDSRYIKNSINDDITGIYVDKTNSNYPEYYLIQKVNVGQLSMQEIAEAGEEKELYKIIYLGVMYQNDSKIVGLEGLNNYNTTLVLNKSQLENQINNYLKKAN